MNEDELISALQRLRRRIFRPRVIVSWRQNLPLTADEAKIARAEERFGFRLPRLLRRIYLEVANGGFGPGYGLLGIEDGTTRKSGLDVVDVYQSHLHADPEDPSWKWPDKLVPLFDWGGFVFSAGDFSNEETPILEFDPTLRRLGDPMHKALRRQAEALHVFLERWIRGENVALQRRAFTVDDLKALAALDVNDEE